VSCGQNPLEERKGRKRENGRGGRGGERERERERERIKGSEGRKEGGSK
jgi:hypothetical protein